MTQVQRLLRHVSVALLVLVGAAISLGLSVPANAQVAGGSLSGIVTDSSNLAIPNAKVSIRNVSTGIVRETVTESGGLYSAPNLPAGEYEVTVSMTGFKTEVEQGRTLTVGAQQVLNVTLQVGEVTEKVEVIGAPLTIDLASSSISGVVDSTTVRELPLNGRSWTDLAALQPGVIQTTTQATSFTSRANRGFGGEASISGARPQQANFRLDGVSINDYTNSAGSVLGGNLGVDSIREFSVITSNYAADYGKTSGGVINAITRSGTNQFHGDVYEFLRNSAISARNFFDRATIPPFRRNQFGGSAGAPIQKDRTFVFGDYEGIRQFKGITQVSTVPSAAMRAGNLSTGTVVVDPYVQKYLAFFPLPNGPVTGDTGTFTFAAPNLYKEDFFTIRVDHKFSDTDSVFGTYLFDKSQATNPDGLNNVSFHYLQQRQFVVLEESHVFSSKLVNTARFGFSRVYVNNNQQQAINPLSGDPTLGNGQPNTFAPQANLPGGLTGILPGLNDSANNNYRWNSFQGYDDIFLTKGLHSMKFGVAFERDQLNQGGPRPVSGTFNFGSLADFLTNKPSTWTATFPGYVPVFGLRQSILGFYGQDDWHVRPNLTLNLGLRYEMATVPNEIRGNWSNLINLPDAAPRLGNPLFSNPTLHNFEPRVGFAWDPFHKGTTSIRSGFGMFDSMPLLYQFINIDLTPAPFTTTGSVSTLPQGSFPVGAALTLSPLRYTHIQQNPPRNYVMQWNLNIQQQIFSNLTATVGYVGSRGLHQPFRTEESDYILPTLTSAGYLWPSVIVPTNKINPNTTGIGGITYLDWQGNSRYDALQIGITRAFTHGLQVQGSFTWGRSLDTGSSVIQGDEFGNSVSNLPWFDSKLNWGPSDFNVNRNLVISAVWQIPTKASGLAAWAVNGWQTGIILTAKDGPPFTAAWARGGDPLGTASGNPYARPNRLTTSDCSSLVNPGNPAGYVKTQCFTVPTAPDNAFYTANCRTTLASPSCTNLLGNAGRNGIVGPALMNLDFSAFKNNYIKKISETFNAQFRVEFFNVLNHTNFNVPAIAQRSFFNLNGTATAGAGSLTSTAADSRQIQFALKLIW